MGEGAKPALNAFSMVREDSTFEMHCASAWPGCKKTAASMDRPRTVMRTMSSVSTPSSWAVRADRSAALSQVSLVIGSGSSCSQPLLA